MMPIATSLILLILFLWSVPAHAVTLANDGESRWVIQVVDDPIPAEVTAARELKEHLETATGALFPIVSGEAAAQKRIIVGPGPELWAAFPELASVDFGTDGIVMKSMDSALYLAGGRPRGTLNAVYTFLEDIVGCRWWTSTERRIPITPKLSFAPLDTVYQPAIFYREPFYVDMYNGEFAARSRVNGHFCKRSEAYGGHYEIILFVHTFGPLLPPERYFADHPEWYAEVKGKRVADWQVQLCLANEECRAELTRNALQLIRENPDAGMISISQGDSGDYCTCAACQAIVDEEGTPAGPLLRFVNKVAAEIEKEYPEVYVETLAYTWSRKPPNIVRPRRNVIIRMCSIECSYAQPLATRAQDPDFVRDIEGWSAISHQLFIWDYVANFRNYILPHPNLHVLAQNIGFFADNKTIGLFEQGDAQCPVGDFVELRPWLLAHLLWDPSQDVDVLIDEFLDGWYGAAAAPIREYLNLVHKAVQESGIRLRCYMTDASTWLKTEQLGEAVRLFDEAHEAVADAPVYAQRVRKSRLALDNACLARYQTARFFPGTMPEGMRTRADFLELADRFFEACRAFGAARNREGGGRYTGAIELYERNVRTMLEPPLPLPPELNHVNLDDVIDFQEGQFALAWEGECSELTDDPAASNGRAARMSTSHSRSGIQVWLPGCLAELGPLHWYALVRCDAKTTTGNAFGIELSGINMPEEAPSPLVSIASVAGNEYRLLDFGTHTAPGNGSVAFTALNNAEAVEWIWVDRVFCLRLSEERRDAGK